MSGGVPMLPRAFAPLGPGLSVILVSGGWTRDAGPPAVTRLTTATDQVGVGTATPLAGSKMEIALDDVVNNAVSNVLVVTHTTSGAPAPGIGAAVLFQVEGAAGAVSAAQVQATLSDVGAGTEASTLVFLTRAGGGALAAQVSIDGNGQMSTRARSVATTFTAGTPYNVAVTDDFVGIDATGGNKVAQLPVAVTGRRVTVKNIALVAVINTVAVTPNGAETIDGVAAAVNLTGTQSLTLVGRTGVGWYVV